MLRDEAIELINAKLIEAVSKVNQTFDSKLQLLDEQLKPTVAKFESLKQQIVYFPEQLEKMTAEF